MSGVSKDTHNEIMKSLRRSRCNCVVIGCTKRAISYVLYVPDDPWNYVSPTNMVFPQSGLVVGVCKNHLVASDEDVDAIGAAVQAKFRTTKDGT